jgi:hypothetical protein
VSRLRSLLRRQDGASAAEFAIVLPLALLLLFGIIDVGRYAWTFNQLQKAAQTGVRVAVVTALVPQGLNSYDFTNRCPPAPLKMGDPICREAMPPIICQKPASAVTCAFPAGVADDPALIGTVDANAFDHIVDLMDDVTPDVTADKVKITYSGSGLGFLGDPHTDAAGNPLSDIAPVVTIEIAGSQMRAISMLGYGLLLPTIKSSLTLEDGDGTQAY